jgi:hypothetical protein
MQAKGESLIGEATPRSEAKRHGMIDFLVQLLASATVSSALAAALVWLSRLWISERLKAAIKNEYDQYLETHKAQLNAQSDIEIGCIRRICPALRLGGRQMRTFVVTAAALVASGCCATAATITIKSNQNGNQPALILVDGDLEPSDGDDFRSMTNFLSKAVIAFHSNGGSVVAGIQIGESIRLKGFTTFVPENALCASACALAWLGGAQRFMAASGQIGFHAAYDSRSGQETGVGNAIVGAYLTKIGLPYEAVIYITQAAPQNMTWLSVSEAIKRGIEVRVLGPSSGPSAVGAARNELQERVSDFVATIFANWSLPNPQALRALEGLYEDAVMYYGKLTSRDEVLKDKRRFVERWPQRSYAVRAGSVVSQCDDGGRCTVSGTADWAAVKDAKRSTGVASFRYAVVLAENGVLKIAGESSKVIQGPIISAHVPGNPPWATNRTPCITEGPKILRENAEEMGVCHN